MRARHTFAQRRRLDRCLTLVRNHAVWRALHHNTWNRQCISGTACAFTVDLLCVSLIIKFAPALARSLGSQLLAVSVAAADVPCEPSRLAAGESVQSHHHFDLLRYQIAHPQTFVPCPLDRAPYSAAWLVTLQLGQTKLVPQNQSHWTQRVPELELHDWSISGFIGTMRTGQNSCEPAGFGIRERRTIGLETTITGAVAVKSVGALRLAPLFSRPALLPECWPFSANVNTISKPANDSSSMDSTYRIGRGRTCLS